MCWYGFQEESLNVETKECIKELIKMGHRKSGRKKRTMGIYIYLDVSFSVTREEWEAVYLETLELVNVFPLCEVVREEIVQRCDVK